MKFIFINDFLNNNIKNIFNYKKNFNLNLKNYLYH